MNDKLKILLNQIGLNEKNYSFFNDGSLDKIVGNKNKDSYKFYLSLNQTLPFKIYIELFDKLKIKYNKYNVFVEIKVKNKDISHVKDYYTYLLKENSLNEPLLETFVESEIEYSNNTLIVTLANKAEEMKFNSIINKLIDLFEKVGYVDTKIETIIDEAKSAEIAKQIELERTKEIVIEKKEPIEIVGSYINSITHDISSILYEEDNVSVEAYVFDVDIFESTKSVFKIFTFKITDYKDSMYAKLFVKNEEDFNLYKKKIKKGNWYKFRGYTKYDKYSNEIVLNLRDVNKSERENVTIKDNASEKRIELHAHTMMSQMDGLVDAKTLVKQAYKWGHKAIAITDHNGVQAFPDVYHTVCDLNKGKEESEKFKAIYGAEFTLIDDSVNITLRENDTNLLSNTYVVFDFETTGFNAGGKDSIIEIGAVKIFNGEIVDTYDELINPGHKLEAKITEVTNITDEMLKDKDNEENAIKRFIEWFSDLPMVAHNAKFDVSFLERCYQKYNLGEFKNPVIDTLELSRVLDNNYARHSLSALVKRYDVEWDENAHRCRSSGCR